MIKRLVDLMVDPKQIISQEKDASVYLGTEKITRQEAKILKDEAITLKNLRLYAVFQNTVRQKAIDIGFSRCKNFEELLTGKLMVHNLEILRDIVNLCENLRVDN